MRVAAIQMTSGHDIDANLEVAGRFLAEAAQARCGAGGIAGKLRLHGPEQRRQARDRRARRRRPHPELPCRHGQAPQDMDRRRHGAFAPGRRRSRGGGQPGVQVRRTACGALRQDPPVRRRRAGQHRVASRIGAYRAGSRSARGGNPDRQARTRGVLRHAFPGAVPRDVAPGRRHVRGAVGIHGAHGQGALGKSVARTGHREPVRPDRAGAVGRASERARDLSAIR